MVLNVHRNQKANAFRDGEKGVEGVWSGGRGR